MSDPRSTATAKHVIIGAGLGLLALAVVLLLVGQTATGIVFLVLAVAFPAVFWSLLGSRPR